MEGGEGKRGKGTEVVYSDKQMITQYEDWRYLALFGVNI